MNNTAGGIQNVLIDEGKPIENWARVWVPIFEEGGTKSMNWSLEQFYSKGFYDYSLLLSASNTLAFLAELTLDQRRVSIQSTRLAAIIDLRARILLALVTASLSLRLKRFVHSIVLEAGRWCWCTYTSMLCSIEPRI